MSVTLQYYLNPPPACLDVQGGIFKYMYSVHHTTEAVICVGLNTAQYNYNV